MRFLLCALLVVCNLLFALSVANADERPQWCKYAKSAAEQTICRERSLWALDKCEDRLFERRKNQLQGPRRRAIVNQERLWISDRDRCGSSLACIDDRYRSRIAQLSGQPIADCPAISTAQQNALTRPVASARGTRCTLRGNETIDVRIGNQQVVAFKPSVSRKPTLTAGEPLPVTVRARLPGAEQCETAVYLVLSIRGPVRLSGNGFFALAPGARGLYHFDEDLDDTRVIFPLAKGNTQINGSASITALQVGTLAMSWKLLEFPIRSRVHSTIKATVPKIKPYKSRKAEHSARFRVQPGRASFRVHDRNFTDRAKQVVYSNDGKYILRIFDGYFEVLAVGRRDVVLRSGGWQPNFSPTSRFLVAYSGGADDQSARVQIYDLVARKSIFSASAANTSDKAVAWGNHDSFAVVDKGQWGSIEFLQPLIDDRVLDDISYQSGRFRPALDATSFRLTIENASLEVAQEFGDPGVYSILHGQSRVDQCGPIFEDRAIRCGKQILREHRHLVRPKIENRKFTDSIPEIMRELRRKWDFGSKLKLSSISSEFEASRALFSEFGVQHSKRASSKKKSDAIQAQAIRHVRMRGFVPVSSSVSNEVWKDLGLSPRILKAGTRIAPKRLLGQITPASPWRNEAFNAFLFTPSLNKFAPRVAEAVSEIRKTSKQFARSFKREDGGDNPCFGYGVQRTKADDTIGLDQLVEQTISQIIRWERERRRIWLVQSLCYTGSTGSGPAEGRLFVYMDDGGRTRFVNLGAGLADQFFLPSASRKMPQNILAWMIGDQLILASKTLGSIAIIDTQSGRMRQLKEVMEQPENLTRLLIDESGKFIFQINNNGRSFLIDINAQRIVLRKAELDGEIITYHDSGFFVGTEESAHYLHVQFEGQSELHTIQQFRKAYHRPELLRQFIQARLRGQPAPARMRADRAGLKAPPSIRVGRQTSSASTVRIEASSDIGLRFIKIARNGSHLRTTSVEGNNVDLTIDLDRIGPSGATWFGFTAEDRNGVESLPVALSNQKTSETPRPKLQVMTVGTDSYDHPSLTTLQSAVADARSIARELAKRNRSNYRVTKVSTFLDELQLREKLLREIRNAKQSLNTGDTLLLHMSGHGLRDKNHRFYYATRRTDPRRLSETALAWSDIAEALTGAKFRVIVLLDACNAGAASAVQANDGAAAALTKASIPILVLAASKGRQVSLEDSSAGGGLFTAKLIDLLRNREALDRNRSGWLELSEIYHPLKIAVSQTTAGKQTPWIARNEMIGEVPLF